MSEQADALSFGPQWIRDLSNGTSVCVPPPSPGPKYKLAEFRYGKEEMLALFSEDLQHPEVTAEIADAILGTEISEPLACIAVSEEEQRNSFGSLNSSAVLKMMGRGGQRGGRGMSRGRGSGRGRGEGGFYRGYSVEELSVKGDDTWQRDAASKRLSWGENGRSGFNERSTSRESDPLGRSLDLSAPPGRYKEPSRALSSGNWRSSSESGETDDAGGGWTVSGSHRNDKWNRGKSWHSQGSREEYHAGGGGGERYSDSWGRGRPDRRSSDDVPEWSKSDNVFEPDVGTFDADGAFCFGNDKKDLHDTGQKSQTTNENESKEDWDKEINEDTNTLSSEKVRNENVQAKKEEMAPSKDAAISIGKKDKEQEDLQGNTTDIQQQANVRQNKMAAAKPTEKMKKITTGVSEQKAADVKPRSVVDNTAEVSKTAQPTSPPHSSHDEIGANLERVAESCIANLDVEGDDSHERPKILVSPTNVAAAERSQSSPVEENTKWFYRDPQGNEQGPFSSEEMVEWFHHGYFTMQLSIRRNCDVVFLPLGEVIKRWQRIPFLPGPSPPPITHHQVMNEQTMMMQQQLLQQHYQQLQKQAILQQIQQQRQPPTPTTPGESSPRPLPSPLTLPVTTHSPVHGGGAAEAIWGTAEPESPKGPWSPVSGGQSVWDQHTRQKSPVPSPEDLKRLEDEKAKLQAEEKAKAEKREAELAALKRRRDEEEKRQQIMKEEEERLQREALQRENEQRLKKQKEDEEEMRRQKERRRLEIQKQTEASRQKKEAQEQKKRKESDEQKQQQRQNEMREQQKQALLKLQQQQVEQREKEQRTRLMQQEQERQEQEKQQQMMQLEQKRQEDMRIAQQQLQQQQQRLKQAEQKKAQSASSLRWTNQNPATLSLSEIQQQEEKNRRAHEEKMRELEARQRQLQSAANSHGWAEKQASPSSVNSLKSIQDEQARQQRSKQSKPAQRTQAQPAPSSGPWAANSGSGNGGWVAGNNNIWAGLSDHDEPAGDEVNGFWAAAARSATSSSKTGGKNQQTLQQSPGKKNTRVGSTPSSVANGKKPGKKDSKEEEKVRQIFQSTVATDSFTEWCIVSLTGLTTSVDIPTFVTFLKEVDSPYEIHDYVRDFFGESPQAKKFAREFIERKRTEKQNAAAAAAAAARPTKPATSSAANAPSKSSSASTVVARGSGGANRVPPNGSEAAPTSNNGSSNNKTNKKKKKQRMQKVDPSILGFSVNAAAERVNMGEIQSIEDAS